MITELAILFNAATRQFGLPEDLLASVCYVESKYDTDAVHHDDGGSDSLGVCQVKLETARWLGFRGTKEELKKADVNIEFAARFLCYQYLRYNKNVEKAVIAYNRGNAKNIEKSEYSTKVFAYWNRNKKSGGGYYEFGY